MSAAAVEMQMRRSQTIADMVPFQLLSFEKKSIRDWWRTRATPSRSEAGVSPAGPITPSRAKSADASAALGDSGAVFIACKRACASVAINFSTFDGGQRRPSLRISSSHRTNLGTYDVVFIIVNKSFSQSPFLAGARKPGHSCELSIRPCQARLRASHPITCEERRRLAGPLHPRLTPQTQRCLYPCRNLGSFSKVRLRAVRGCLQDPQRVADVEDFTSGAALAPPRRARRSPSLRDALP
eukprot:6190089-Pleurochrysis_carterae.AAC.1